jgi:hypothetical protein
MRRPGADLIAHYLNPDRLPVRDRWSRKHADTQRRLCLTAQRCLFEQIVSSVVLLRDSPATGLSAGS